MSDASVSSECSELVFFDASSVAAIGSADNDIDFDDAHQMDQNISRDDDPPAQVAKGPVDTNDPKPSHNNSDDDDDDELPNLAKLVAAAVRDRVVLEQMEEIRALKAQLNGSHRVEVTGPNGAPVYARGNFSEGDFNPLSLERAEDDAVSTDDAGPLFWDVGLEMTADRGDGNDAGGMIPLNRLAGVEIRVGGVLYVTAAEVEGTRVAFGIRPGNEFDLRRGSKDMSRGAVAEFNTEDAGPGKAGARAALLTFHVRDFPRGHWRSLQSVAMLNRSIALRQREREEAREASRELRQVERSERIERGEIDPEEEYESEDESDYEDEDEQDPLDVYSYLTHCLSKRHPEQRADITSVSLCVRSVRGRIEGLDRGGDFRRTREKVFRTIDERHQAQLDGVESLEDALAPLNDA